MTDRPQHYVQTTEKTGKEWKAGMLIGGLAAVASVPTCVCSSVLGESGQDVESWLSLIGVAMFMGGIGVYAFCRIGAWWHHG